MDVPVDALDSPAVLSAASKVRDHIAARWCSILPAGPDAPEVADFRKRVKELAEQHGGELPFAPLPSTRTPEAPPLPEAVEEADSPNRQQDDRSELHLAPHVFRFLKTSDGVWTVLQVSLMQESCAITWRRHMLHARVMLRYSA